MASLNYCRSELQSIINELVSIEEGVRYDFKGIGQQHCADCLDTIISKYRYVLRQLNNVDTNRLADFINGEG
ncbi:MAG: hypothetical protein IJN10_07135 [Firmicutes bacterium]|nr:hypothetical protein [Bacillota bacterium]